MPNSYASHLLNGLHVVAPLSKGHCIQWESSHWELQEGNTRITLRWILGK